MTVNIRIDRPINFNTVTVFLTLQSEKLKKEYLDNTSMARRKLSVFVKPFSCIVNKVQTYSNWVFIMITQPLIILKDYLKMTQLIESLALL